ncbi:hypothetical protein ACWT_7477 [Actinoplanes sp. SE50]|nr:hypothetical protein ACPL_7607 [Actinoplanes sp. SE50/110]ATO86892.1 hypothetical protein ACWT_7477 [Actinoplanes sp. SE50]SLM04310.1 hypothetical protein ACSP50_7615 [Actinoplanes sp. SE50/110]
MLRIFGLDPRGGRVQRLMPAEPDRGVADVVGRLAIDDLGRGHADRSVAARIDISDVTSIIDVPSSPLPR